VRPRALASASFVSALAGAGLVLLAAWAAGWLHGERRSVVIQDTGAAVQVSPAARPLTGGRFDPAQIYGQRSAGVVTIYSVFGSDASASASQGSGFVVSRDGVILTNSHVITTAGPGVGSVSPARFVYVEFRDRDRVAAKVVGWDVFDDVGVLRVDPKDHPLSPLPLGDSSRVVVGEPVAAIGSPFGNENSLAVGVVSATQRSIESLTSRYNLVDAIQVDAPINHGNSGGPLFDSHGRVIGINAQIRSETGNAEGVGFAVPINAARRSMEQLLATGRVAYAWVPRSAASTGSRSRSAATCSSGSTVARFAARPMSFGSSPSCAPGRWRPSRSSGTVGGSRHGSCLPSGPKTPMAVVNDPRRADIEPLTRSDRRIR
jgi:S1-C subfamily serine protease